MPPAIVASIGVKNCATGIKLNIVPIIVKTSPIHVRGFSFANAATIDNIFLLNSQTFLAPFDSASHAFPTFLPT